MTRHERIGGPAPFVIEHGEVGMTDSAVAGVNLYFLGREFTRIEAERLKRGMRLGSCVSMEGGGHSRSLDLRAPSSPILSCFPLGLYLVRKTFDIYHCVLPSTGNCAEAAKTRSSRPQENGPGEMLQIDLPGSQKGR